MIKRTVLLILIFIAIIPAISAQQKFKVDADFYKNNSAEIKDVKILDATRNTNFRKVRENFSLKGYSNGSEVFSGVVPLSFETYIRTENGGAELTQEKISKSLYIDYNSDIDKFSLIHQNETLDSFLLEKNLCVYDGKCSSYCSSKDLDPDCTCGDNVCQDFENEEICAEDCGDSPPVSKPTNEPVRSERDESAEPSFGYIYVLIGVFVAILVWLLWRSDL